MALRVLAPASRECEPNTLYVQVFAVYVAPELIVQLPVWFQVLGAVNATPVAIARVDWNAAVYAVALPNAEPALSEAVD